MDVTTALRAGPALLRRRTGALLPYYLLAASAPAVARAPILVAIGAAGWYLSAIGRLEPVVTALGRVEPVGGEAGSGPLPVPEPTSVPPELVDAIGGLVTPVSVGLLVGGVAGGGVLLVLVRGTAVAGTTAAVDAGLRGRDPLPAGVRGIRDHWRPFVLLSAVRAGTYLLGAGLAVALVAVGGAAGLVVAVLGGLVAVPFVVGFELVVAFAGAAVVVDDVGAVGAVRRASGLLVDRPLAYLALLVVGGGLLGGLLVVGFLFLALGIGRTVGLVSTLLVFPVLDGIRVALYADRGAPGVGAEAEAPAEAERDGRTTPVDDPGAPTVRSGPRDGRETSAGTDRDAEDEGEDDPDETDGWSPPTDVPSPTTVGRTRVVAPARRVLVDGLGALGRFVRDEPVANVAAGALLVAGFAVGWLAVAPFGIEVGAPENPGTVFGAVPVGEFVNIAANNWLVAASAGYAGLAAGVGTVVALLFNGVLVGAVAAVFDPVAVVALVGPHGLLEFPAIAVAGGLGLHLGRVGLGAVRGRRSAPEVAAELRTALRVLVGLAVVFVVAAAMEAFVTPRVAAAVVG